MFVVVLVVGAGCGSEIELRERGPTGIWFLAVAAGEPGTARGLTAGSERQLQQDRVPHELLEVELVAIEWIRLPVQGLGLEQLVDPDVHRLFQGAQATAALGGRAGPHPAPHHDALVDTLEHHVDAHGRGDPGRGADQAVELLGEGNLTARSGMREEIGDIDSESSHVRASLEASAPGGTIPSVGVGSSTPTRRTLRIAASVDAPAGDAPLRRRGECLWAGIQPMASATVI
jgi:hypothetical protein